MGAPARVAVRWSAQLDKAPVWLEVAVVAVTTSGIDKSAGTPIGMGCGGTGAEAKHSCLQVPGAFRRLPAETHTRGSMAPSHLAPGKGSRVSSSPAPVPCALFLVSV